MGGGHLSYKPWASWLNLVKTFWFTHISTRMCSADDEVSKNILNKWTAQEYFIRFLDGNKQNCAVENLKCVSLKDGMEHFDEWVFDWDMNLTKKEKARVINPEWRNGVIQIDREHFS